MTLDIDRRAALWGDRVAIIDDTTETRMSYAELDTAARRTATQFGTRGAKSGDAVVVISRNRPALIAMLFGARRCGVTLAPVSHRLPPDAVGAVADRIDPALVVYEDRFDELAEAISAPGVPIADIQPTEIQPDRSGQPPENSNGGAHRHDQTHPPLYLHTGGTTGTPKVVVITDRQLEWNCITEVAAWGLGRHTVAPILLPMFHTGGWLLLTLPTLYVGGRILLQRSFDPGATLGLIEEHEATNVFGVAAMFEAMADHPAFAATDFSSVEWFMSGGGPTPTAVMDTYRERDETFVQGYGLTEGGPNNLYVDPTRPDAHSVAEASVGQPFPDCAVRIVDEDGHEVGPATVGELEVAGPITADRYLDTADGTFDGEWVSTGDLAKRDEAGDYSIVGRTDNMFISGGENVAPESIEETLEDHPDVKAVGVVPIDHQRWGQVPKAVVVPSPSAEIDLDELDSYAHDRLADHEAPTTYVLADALPTSGPGKLDRHALRESYQ